MKKILYCLEQADVKSYKIISTYRTQLMGVAILWVVLFHATFSINNPLQGIKAIGYGGVDIFLMLSGMGLYFSYKKIKIKDFYSRRLMRVLPTYIPLVLIFTMVFSKFDVLTIFLNATTLSFWLNRGNRFDWYIPALIFLYLITPLYLKYFLKNKKCVTILGVLLPIVLSIIISDTKLNDLLIFTTRIPIFLIGILIGYYVDINKAISNKTIILNIVSLILGLFWLFFNLCYLNNYLWSFGLWWYPFILITLPLCLLLSIVFEYCKGKFTLFHEILLFFGTYSLEIYIFHERILKLINNLDLNINIVIMNFIAIILTLFMSVLWHKMIAYILSKVTIKERGFSTLVSE